MSMLHQLCSHSCSLEAPVNQPNSSTAFLGTVNFPVATTIYFNIHNTNYFLLAGSCSKKTILQLTETLSSLADFPRGLFNQQSDSCAWRWRLHLSQLSVPTYSCAFFVGPGAFEACHVECARISLSLKMLFAFNILSCVKIFISLIEHIHMW